MFEFFFLRQRQMADAKSTATSSNKCPAFLSRYLQQISLAASFSKFFALACELSFAVWISSAIISFCSEEGDALMKAKWTQASFFIWISENQYCCVFVISAPQCLVHRLKSFNNLCSCNWLNVCSHSREKGQWLSLHVSSAKFPKAGPALLGLCWFIQEWKRANTV